MPTIDRQIVDNHRQLDPLSCIPSSVELVLKLLRRVPEAFYDLQRDWRNKRDGSFRDFDGRTIAGIRFTILFHDFPRGSEFPLTQLFDTIDNELAQGRFVIVSLANPAGWHMYVLYGRSDDGDYLNVSKASDGSARTISEPSVKTILGMMRGSDILTYSLA
jgi:hypothetical protein